MIFSSCSRIFSSCFPHFFPDGFRRFLLAEQPADPISMKQVGYHNLRQRLNVFQLTITKKKADVHFTRMHCGRKSFKKGNGRLLKDRHKEGG